MLICQSIELFGNASLRASVLSSSIVELCAIIIALLTIVLMPMRNPDLGASDVCGPFKPPTYHLRSPEDNMTLWQFMTVAWMAPLISVGSKKQLNDEDVWLLPYEFQHSRLHDLFRDIKGSVLTRLLQANAIDLIITSFLGILELLASMLSLPGFNAYLTCQSRDLRTCLTTAAPPLD